MCEIGGHARVVRCAGRAGIFRPVEDQREGINELGKWRMLGIDAEIGALPVTVTRMDVVRLVDRL